MRNRQFLLCIGGAQPGAVCDAVVQVRCLYSPNGHHVSIGYVAHSKNELGQWLASDITTANQCENIQFDCGELFVDELDDWLQQANQDYQACLTQCAECHNF